MVNEAWEGEAVEGFETIISPTNMVWITGRIAGIYQNEPKPYSSLSESVRHQLVVALSRKQSEYLGAFYEGKAQTKTWIFNTERMGVWGTDYARRAYWGMWGLARIL
ncbi:MAG: hypothetical protein ACI9FB_000831 [Candidatus Azotimanducaceae bacterium]